MRTDRRVTATSLPALFRFAAFILEAKPFRATARRDAQALGAAKRSPLAPARAEELLNNHHPGHVGRNSF
ncbi:MAG: hypothetical protein ACUVWS_04070, partial [Roseiflexus sp.]